MAPQQVDRQHVGYRLGVESAAQVPGTELRKQRQCLVFDLRIADAQGLDELRFVRVEAGPGCHITYQRRIEVEVQVPHVPPPLQVPFAWRSRRQHDDAARANVSLLPPKFFLGIEGAAEVDDVYVARDGRRAKVILGVMDLVRIGATPTPATA